MTILSVFFSKKIEIFTTRPFRKSCFFISREFVENLIFGNKKINDMLVLIVVFAKQISESILTINNEFYKVLERCQNKIM